MSKRNSDDQIKSTLQRHNCTIINNSILIKNHYLVDLMANYFGLGYIKELIKYNISDTIDYQSKLLEQINIKTSSLSESILYEYNNLKNKTEKDKKNDMIEVQKKINELCYLEVIKFIVNCPEIRFTNDIFGFAIFFTKNEQLIVPISNYDYHSEDHRNIRLNALSYLLNIYNNKECQLKKSSMLDGLINFSSLVSIFSKNKSYNPISDLLKSNNINVPAILSLCTLKPIICNTPLLLLS